MKYESVKKFSITVPAISSPTASSKIPFIKSLRELTHISLKEAVDVFNRHSIVQLMDLNTSSHSESYISTQIKTLRDYGCIIMLHNVDVILEDLRKLAIRAIDIKEDNLGNEIMQLVLAEKLRRVPTEF
jgi:hypothetical protein